MSNFVSFASDGSFFVGRTHYSAKRKGFYEENPPDDWEECGCCEGYHPADFTGDCRDDVNRWPSDKAIARLERENEKV